MVPTKLEARISIGWHPEQIANLPKYVYNMLSETGSIQQDRFLTPLILPFFRPFPIILVEIWACYRSPDLPFSVRYQYSFRLVIRLTIPLLSVLLSLFSLPPLVINAHFFASMQIDRGYTGFILAVGVLTIVTAPTM